MRPAEVEEAGEVDLEAVGGFFRQCLNCLRREERFEKLVAGEAAKHEVPFGGAPLASSAFPAD